MEFVGRLNVVRDIREKGFKDDSKILDLHN